MADRSTQHILDALSRALAEPAGLPLHTNRKMLGLFPSTAPGKAAATRGKAEGLLRSMPGDPVKGSVEKFGITEKGIAFLLEHSSPKAVLEDLVRALEARQVQVGELVEAARQWQVSLDTLRGTLERVLQGLGTPRVPGHETASAGPKSDAWLAEVAACLGEWHAAGHAADCPIPVLYRRSQAVAPALTLGHFHDGLRRLHEQGRVYLHPWTGPLYEMPEPACALLVGHEIAYYASTRA